MQFNKTRNYFLPTSLIGVIFLYGCIGGGTHGYIKRYRYAVPKSILENAVHVAILKNPAIHQDSVKGYYNDDTNYVSINILDNHAKFTYTTHYFGGKEYWDTASTSAISIVYAHDDNGKGGSQGNGGVKWYNFSLKKKLTKPFEKEFISKIDSILAKTHTEE